MILWTGMPGICSGLFGFEKYFLCHAESGIRWISIKQVAAGVYVSHLLIGFSPTPVM
jgi:hypothetical protein